MTEARLARKGRQSTLDYMASRESLKEGGGWVIMMFQELEELETRRIEWRDRGPYLDESDGKEREEWRKPV